MKPTHLLLNATLLALYTLPQFASATTSAITSATVSGTHLAATPLYQQNTGNNGQSSVANSTLATDGTVYSGAAPYPPVGSQIAQASASASAIEGALRVSVSAGTQTAGLVYNAASANSWASASWADSLIVNAGDLFLNQSGFITAQMNVSGNSGGNPGDIGKMATGVRILGTGMAADINCGLWAYCITQSASNSVYFGGPQLIDINTFPSTVSLMIPVSFGQSVTLNYVVDLYATAEALTFAYGNPNSSAAFSDFSNTFSWGGITGAFDANGNALSNFSVSSASGFNYMQSAVPVPAAVWTFSSGLLGLIAISRRRKKDTYRDFTQE